MNFVWAPDGMSVEERDRYYQEVITNSFVHVPSLRAVVTHDIVFDHVYFGVPRDAARENWLKSIDQIVALKPAIVVPGHEAALLATCARSTS